MGNEIITQIDAAIKSIWLNEIPKDYSGRHLLKEDSLKNAFYFHLRSALSTLLEKNNLRIFPEFNDASIKKKGYRADLAIVKVPQCFTGYMGNAIKEEDVYAIIELKYVSGRQSGINAVLKDVQKLKQYIQQSKFPECQYYLGIIHETSFDSSQLWWLDKRQTNNWANGRVTELGACYIDNADGLGFMVTSYNNLNSHLNEAEKNIKYAELGV